VATGSRSQSECRVIVLAKRLTHSNKSKTGTYCTQIWSMWYENS
jgi:hypothetical protein